MPSRYDSIFWFQRSQETLALSERMTDEQARGDMSKLARKYERVALQRAYDEARAAFESAREALRASQQTASTDQIISITKTVDTAWNDLQKARKAIDLFRSAHLQTVDGVEVVDDDDVVSAR